MPHLDRLQREFGDRGLVVLTVARDERDDVREFAAKHPYSMRSAYRPLAGSFLDGVDTTPFSLVIDKAGLVRDSVFGATSHARFRRLVEPYL